MFFKPLKRPTIFVPPEKKTFETYPVGVFLLEKNLTSEVLKLCPRCVLRKGERKESQSKDGEDDFLVKKRGEFLGSMWIFRGVSYYITRKLTFLLIGKSPFLIGDTSSNLVVFSCIMVVFKGEYPPGNESISYLGTWGSSEKHRLKSHFFWGGYVSSQKVNGCFWFP